MKLQSFKRLIKEEVEEQFRPLIDRVGYSINPFAQDVLIALNKNLTIADNLLQQIKQVEVTVDTTGTPKTTSQFKSDLPQNIIGMNVIKVENLTNTSVYPTGHPFISFDQSSGVITIKNITGLVADNKYRLTINTIGG